MIAFTKKYIFNEVFDSQKVYRLLLDAMSNPTRIVSIKEYSDKLFGKQPEMLALAITLLDNEVSFAVCGHDIISDEIVFLSQSPKASTESADYIFVTEPLMLETAVSTAKCGTLRDPHKSATLIVKNEGEPSCSMKLHGPGIEETVEFEATEAVKTAVELRDAQEYEYPQGVDLVFVSNNGDMFALPRLVMKEA